MSTSPTTSSPTHLHMLATDQGILHPLDALRRAVQLCNEQDQAPRDTEGLGGSLLVEMNRETTPDCSRTRMTVTIAEHSVIVDATTSPHEALYHWDELYYSNQPISDASSGDKAKCTGISYSNQWIEERHQALMHLSVSRQREEDWALLSSDEDTGAHQPLAELWGCLMQAELKKDVSIEDSYKATFRTAHSRTCWIDSPHCAATLCATAAAGMLVHCWYYGDALYNCFAPHP